MIKLTKLFSLADIVKLLPSNQRVSDGEDYCSYTEDNTSTDPGWGDAISEEWGISNSEEENCSSSSSHDDCPALRPSPGVPIPSAHRGAELCSPALAHASPTYLGMSPEDDPASPIHVATTKPRGVPCLSGTPDTCCSDAQHRRSLSSLRSEQPSSVTEGLGRRGLSFLSANAPQPSQSVDNSRAFCGSLQSSLSATATPRGGGIADSIPSNLSPAMASSSLTSLVLTSGIVSENQVLRGDQAIMRSLAQSHRPRGSDGLSMGGGATSDDGHASQPVTPVKHRPRIATAGGSGGSGSCGGAYSVSSDSDDWCEGRRLAGRCFKVSVVGSDYNSGLLFVAVMHRERTFLNSFSVKARQLTPIYTWDEALDIVWVSMNSLFKIVGVTVVRQISRLYAAKAPLVNNTGGSGSNATGAKGPSSSCYYETFIQCLDETKKHYIGEKTANAQKTQFTFDKAPQGAAVSSALAVESRFLHIISSHSVVLYTVTSQRKSPHTALYTIAKPPQKELTVCNEFLWARYVDRTKIFYCLFVVNDKKSGKGVRCSLKNVSLATSEPRVLSDKVFSLCFTLSMRINTLDESFPFPYVLRDSSLPPRHSGNGASPWAPVPKYVSLPNITLVTLRSGVACLCIQHETMRSTAPISVIDTYLKTRVDFSVPIPQGKDSRTFRVFFAPFYDYLLAYVPDVYLHLLDFSAQHNPSAGLLFSGPGLVTAPLPAPSRHLFATMGPLLFKGFSQHRMFVDARTGDVLEYAVDTPGVLQLVDEQHGDSTFLCRLLHAALVHFRDDALVSDILARMLKAHPRQVTPELLKEYVLGETFLRLTNELPPQVIPGVPPTTADQDRFLAKTLKAYGFLEEVSIVPMTSPRGRRAFESIQPYPSVSLWWDTLRDREAARIKSLARGTARSTPPLSSQASSSPYLQQGDEAKLKSVVLNKKSAYLRPFRDAAGNSLDDTLTRTPAGDYIDDVILEMAADLAKYYFAWSGQKMDSSTAQSYAEKAHSIQAGVVDILFATIISAFSESEEAKNDGPSPKAKKPALLRRREAHTKKVNMFIVLENFLNAIVELGRILYPNGFIKKFAYLGYQCLPDVVFLQYAERGTIRITKDFVWTLYMKGVHMKKPDLFYRVASRLPWYEMTEMFISQIPPPLFVVDHCFSKNYKALTYGKVELSDNSSMFIPLTQILRTLKISAEEQKLLTLLPARKKYSQDVIENQHEIKVLLKIIEGLSFEYCFKFLDLDTSEKADGSSSK